MKTFWRTVELVKHNPLPEILDSDIRFPLMGKINIQEAPEINPIYQIEAGSDNRKVETDYQIKKQCEKRKVDYAGFFDSFA